jgi:NADP-dependent 3-hydroxy acid dehydrogenase YdfG
MLEVRKYNIRVVAICPGTVSTEFFRPEANTPLSSSVDTVLHPIEIAETCLYAASLPLNAMVNEIEIRPTNPK